MDDVVRIQDFDDPGYDPFASDAVNFGDHADPYPKIAELRTVGMFAPFTRAALLYMRSR